MTKLAINRLLFVNIVVLALCFIVNQFQIRMVSEVDWNKPENVSSRIMLANWQLVFVFSLLVLGTWRELFLRK